MSRGAVDVFILAKDSLLGTLVTKLIEKNLYLCVFCNTSAQLEPVGWKTLEVA